MRIAQVAPPWIAVPPKGYGGIEWVVSLLADGLAERGHEVTLFATGDSITKANLESVFPEAPGPKHINSLWHDTVHALFSFRDAGRFDVIHVHSTWSSLAAAAASPVPAVHTVHGSFTGSMRVLYEQVGDRVSFVAISESQRHGMPELNYAGVVHNGIDLSIYPFRERKEDFLLFLGRAAPEKGALRAVLTARETGLPLVCAVKLADPAEVEHWETDIEPLLPPGTEVLGEIEHERKADLLSRARAVLFPIDWEEPFGLVTAEAMACGTPVIATERGAVPEIIEDGVSGFLVPVDDYVHQAAERLERLFEIDPTACRARIQERFSKESMVAGYERVFERVATRA